MAKAKRQKTTRPTLKSLSADLQALQAENLKLVAENDAVFLQLWRMVQRKDKISRLIKGLADADI